MIFTAQKVSISGVILVRIFPAFSHIWTEYRIQSKYVKIWENVDQNNSEYGTCLQ